MSEEGPPFPAPLPVPELVLLTTGGGVVVTVLPLESDEAFGVPVVATSAGGATGGTLVAIAPAPGSVALFVVLLTAVLLALVVVLLFESPLEFGFDELLSPL